MKKIDILAIMLVSFLGISCSDSHLNSEEAQNNLTRLQKQTEQDNPLVSKARHQLSSLVGITAFDQYVVDKGILRCQTDLKPSECALNFYLTEYYTISAARQEKKAILKTQQTFRALANYTNKVDNYCHHLADLIIGLYTKLPSQQITYYQQLFKLDDNQLTALKTKVKKERYSHFLISENPTVADEMKSDFIQQCRAEPKLKIVNYSVLFR